MYKLNPHKKELTPNEATELMMFLISHIMRPNRPGENNVVLDTAFYDKLPDNLKEVFEEVK